MTDAIGEGFSHAPATTVGKFYRATAWVYSAANSVVIGSGVTLHNGATTGVTSTAGASWKRVSFVFRAVAVNTTIGFISTAAVQTFYVDDFSVGVLDDVLLTITPASQANSLEGTGIRADGYDLLSTPTAGEMAYNWWYAEVFITPRHSDATVGLFGIATPCWIEFRYNAANTLLLDWSAANTLRLRVITGGVTYTGTWATGGGAVLAGTKYLIKIEQYYGEYRVYVGGIQRITIPGVPAFPFVPNIAYWGMDNARAYNSDIVVSSY